MACTSYTLVNHKCLMGSTTTYKHATISYMQILQRPPFQSLQSKSAEQAQHTFFRQALNLVLNTSLSLSLPLSLIATHLVGEIHHLSDAALDDELCALITREQNHVYLFSFNGGSSRRGRRQSVGRVEMRDRGRHSFDARSAELQQNETFTS